jgi:hypothetical protein
MSGENDVLCLVLTVEQAGERIGVKRSTMRVIRNSPTRAFADLNLIVSKVLISARRA